MDFRSLLATYMPVVIACLCLPGVSFEHGALIKNAVPNHGIVGTSAPELANGRWINSPPLKLSDLKGTVVLLEFWTYGCFNCRHTILYLKEWYEKYGGKDFTIIGVHTPEFEAERDFSRVLAQCRNLGVGYPVVTDNDLKTWRAYNQEYWPVQYLIDKKGIVRSIHIGEGDYAEMERSIHGLLKE